jgi:hypothetical protein
MNETLVGQTGTLWLENRGRSSSGRSTAGAATVEVECEFWGPKKQRVTNERHCSPDTVRHVSRCLHQSDTIDTCDSDHRPQATRKVDGDHDDGLKQNTTKRDA